MSERRYEGLVSIREVPPRGMVSLRAAPSDPALAAALRRIGGPPLPEPRRITEAGPLALAWMSPDEWLLLCPPARAAPLAAELDAALEGHHHLVLDVSDMRATFTLKGAHLRDVLARLTPADLAPGALGPGEMRRSRLAQIAAAFWFSAPDEISLICFRSVADYAFAVLASAAAPGGETGFFPPAG